MNLWELIPPMPTREQAADAMGILASPAKRLAGMFGYLPEGYRWQTPAEESKWMEDAALGFAGSVTPKVSPMMGIRAYHGSPYDFDKFSMSKIGTGEGAQAYGHGLYFAEAQPTAQFYRDALMRERMPRVVQQRGDITLAEKRIAELEKMARGEIPRPVFQRTGAAVDDAWLAKEIKSEKDFIVDAEAWIKAHPATGRMYEVNIRAKPEEFLDWDKPLSGQAQSVRNAMSDLGVGAERTLPWAPQVGADGKWRLMHRDSPSTFIGGSYPTRDAAETYLARMKYMGGDAAYRELKNPATASAALRDAGIPGIRYLDQGSRAAGDGSRNYVLFRDDIIDILRKYGIPGVGVAGAGALAPHMLPPQQQY